MELKHIIPNMEKTFGVLEFAGEGKLSNDVLMDDSRQFLVVITYIQRFNVQMILLYYYPMRQEKKYLNQNNKFYWLTHALLQKVIRLEHEVLQIIFC